MMSDNSKPAESGQDNGCSTPHDTQGAAPSSEQNQNENKKIDEKERERKDSWKSDDGKTGGKKEEGRRGSLDKGRSQNEGDDREKDGNRTSEKRSDSGSKGSMGDVKGGKDGRSDRGRRGGKGDGAGDRGGRRDSEGRDRNNSGNQRNRKDSGRKDSGDKSREGSSATESGAELLSLINKTPKKLSDKKKAEMKAASDLEAQWQREEEERRKKEEEEKKEQERIRLEEEKKRQEEEEKLKKIEEEKKLLADYIQENKERNAFKEDLRKKNKVAVEDRPDESFFSKLDSSLKKNTAFVKKLRNLTEQQRESLSKDFMNLNLSKYIGEAAAAITEAKLKMSDINCALLLCSLFHQRYAEFVPALLEYWHKVLVLKKEEKISNASKLRVDLRFFAELVAVGVISQKEGLPVLANQLTVLVNTHKDNHSNLSIMISFAKHCGDEYAGLIPRKYRLFAEKYGNVEIPRSQFLKAERQKACRNLIKDYFNTLSKYLVSEHKNMQAMEKQNRKILQTKGELSKERKERYEVAYTSYHKLYTNAVTFADLLDEDLPDLPDDKLSGNDPDGIGLDIFNPQNAEYQYDGDSSLFEDEETRMFYESLPDLKASIPGILYKDSMQAAAPEVSEEGETGLEEDMENLKVEDVEKEMEAEKQKQEKEETEKKKSGDKNKKEEEEEAEHAAAPVVEDDDDVATTFHILLESFLGNLPKCVNRELIDQAAKDFCTNLNTKSNRKKLVRTLFTVHRTRYDLLPFYARFVATLFPCMPDVANDLASLLKGDFKWHVRKKDQINIESKLKTVRFIGEMVKFNRFPKSDALQFVKMLLFDFHHHNIEMACALLECCGRFLYRSPDSHHRTKVYLEVMMRKKRAIHLDSRYTMMIENAFHYSNPPEVPQIQQKERPPMHEYIRKLLYKDLSKITTEKVLRQMRKLNWDKPEEAQYAVKCLTAIWNVRYNTIHCAANLLAGLAPYHEQVAIQVVDGVIEDIRLGLEVNHPKFNQRRVSCVKYLGELYNYRMVESAVIFNMLYTFITFAVSYDESNPSPFDPPEHLFRLRLVCVLLDTCGQYFDRGSSKKKLDYFLVYYMRYYWFKHSASIWTENCPFPLDAENMVQDTMECIRPKLKWPNSYETACKDLEDLEKEFKSKLAHILPVFTETEEGEEEDGEGGLSTIRESDEGTIEELSEGFSQSRFTTEESTQDDSEMDDDRDFTGGSQSQSQTVEHAEDGGEEKREGEEESTDEYLTESAGEDEMDDEVTLRTGGPKHVQCAEDEDFMSEFDKVIADSIKQRTAESTKIPSVHIVLPVSMPQQKKPAIPDLTQPKETNSIMNFVLMTRKGNKQQFSELNVPITAEFAAKYKARKEADRLEKEQMKRVVLDIHERQEEEDYQEMLAGLQRSTTSNQNRERRVRYQHPKGAPDADLIFGSKPKR